MVGRKNRIVASSALALMLAACGGGGSGGPGSAPPPPPTPTPPSPPPPTSGTNDAEYQASNSATSSKAIAAYDKGATGSGVKVAVVDTGINPNLPDFAGRIDPASQDVAANRGISDDEGHGSMVSGVIAANRDGQFTQGVAYNATILSLNVYDPAGCKPGNDCFLDDKIDEAIDLARTNGAKIINMSFGSEEGMTPDIWPALQRAVDAGIVMVMSAGNGGTGNPNSFALQNIQNNGGSGLFIIAGAMDSNRNISSFSDRAGSTAAAQHYLTALGRGNATVNHLGQHVQVNGTSFAAPTIAGAAALLASAFPNLSGSQIVSILLNSADDAGTAGTDATFGRGILNIERAFLPSGTTSLAGSATPVSLTANGYSSAPMGDAAALGSAGAVVLDGFSRAYVLDLARTIRAPSPEQPLRQNLTTVGYRSTNASVGPLSVAITVRRNAFGEQFAELRPLRLTQSDRQKAELVSGLAVTRLSESTSLAIGLSQSGRSLQQRLAQQSSRAFLVAQDPMTRSGFHGLSAKSMGLRHDLGPVAVTVTGETGSAFEPWAWREQGRSRYQAAAVSIDRKAGPFRMALGASRLIESDTLLGAHFSAPIANNGATTTFFDSAADLTLGRGWIASAAYRRGQTRTSAGQTGLATNAWSLDLARDSLFHAGDALAFRMMQPLRVSHGGLQLNLPTGYDYASGKARHERRLLNLAPTGRELAYELAYGRPFMSGFLDLNAFYRSDPGHIETQRRDVGAALRFTVR